MSATDEISAKQERGNRQKRAQRDRDARIRRTVLGSLLGAQDGRRYLWLELESSNFLSGSYFPGDSFDAVAFREGKRSHGLTLYLELVSVNPESVTLMMRENSQVLEEAADERTTEPDAD